jgi:bilin biosynthesis protein
LALQDVDLDVRKAAVNSLGKMGNALALEALQNLLDDQEQVIKVLAKIAIAQIHRQAEED